MTSSAFIFLQATQDWLELPERAQRRIRARDIDGVLKDGERVTFLPRHAAGGGATHVALIEAEGAEDWLWTLDRLRETELFERPWFRLTGVMPGPQAEAPCPPVARRPVLRLVAQAGL